MPSYIDTFTDTNGVLLENHTPDSPTPFTWTKRGSDDLLINTDCVVSEPGTAGGASCRYTADVDPYDSDADEDTVEVAVIVNGNVSSMGMAILIVVDPAGPTLGNDQSDGYRFVWSKNISSQFIASLGRVTNGGVNSLDGTGVMADLSDGTHTFRLARNRATGLVSAYIDDVEIMSAVDNTYPVLTHIGLDGGTNGLSYVIGSLAAGDPYVPEPEPEPGEECFPDETEPVDDPAVAVMDCPDEPTAPSFMNHGVFYTITPGDECLPVGVVAAACWEVGDGTQVGDGSGICAIASQVVFFDDMEDTIGVALQDHIPTPSPTPFNWSKQGAADLLYYASDQWRKPGGGTVYYRADTEIGGDDQDVSWNLRREDSGFQDVFCGVSARHTAVDGVGGIYFGLRSGSDLDSVRMFGWDDDGNDLFTELEVGVPPDAVGVINEIRLVVEGGVATGYIGDEEVLQQTGLTWLTGQYVGLTGGWRHDILNGEALFSRGPWSASLL